MVLWSLRGLPRKIESARRRCLDPLAYLHDILQRRPVTAVKDIHTLTPAAWAMAQKQKAE